MLRGEKEKKEKKKKRKITTFDLGEVGPEPSALAEPALAGGLDDRPPEAPSSLSHFVIWCPLPIQCEGRLSKPAKCFCCAFVFHLRISHKLTLMLSTVLIKQLG